MGEEWRKVSLNPRYEVSDLGNVRTVTMETENSKGVKVLRVGQTIKPSLNSTDRWTVSIWVNGKAKRCAVHRLICEAFHGPAPEGKPWALHRNGQHQDNRPGNLYWGDAQDNVDDMMRHGTHYESAKGTCVRGHLKTEENWYPRPDGNGGQCRKCNKLRAQEARHNPPEEGSRLHGRYATYLGRGCRCEMCVNAMKEYRSRFDGVELPAGDTRHGLTGALTYKCKCTVCLTAARSHYKRQREKRKSRS